MKDAQFMRRAIELAEQGRGWTSPYPMSGAVVVKEDQIVGEGFLPQVGQSHAEVFALDAAGSNAEGGTLYVTVEPCVHGSRNSACVQRIIDSGIERVVVGIEDPNPMVSGKGIRALLDAGVHVEVGIERETTRRLNESVFKFITTKRPFVALRTAMSLDGKIATAMGESQYIGGDETREHLQLLRASYDAVIVGINTVLRDNPDVSCVLPRGRQPLRVVIDSMARTPTTCKLFNKPATGLLRTNTLIACTKYAPEERIRALQAVGAEILIVPEVGDMFEPHVDLNKLMQMLGRREVTSVLLEGGGTLNAAALSAGIVDKVYATVAPMIIGGQSTMTPVEGLGVTFVEEAIQLHQMRATTVGSDLLIEAYLRADV